MITVTESPSALLERAAELIERRASLAVIGPWATVGPRVTAGPDEDWHVADCTTSTTAAWIAMLDPRSAHPLVEWLRETVELYRAEHSRRTVPAEALDEAWMRHPAVRFVRQVLGES